MAQRLGLIVSAVMTCTLNHAFAQPSAPTPTSPPPPTQPPPVTQPPANNPAVAPTGPLDTFKQIRIGARVGVNFASVMSEPEDERVQSRTGIALGGFVSYAFSRRWALEVGVGYSQRGFRLEPDFFTGQETVLEFDYFEAPALIHARFGWGTTPATIRLFGGFNALFLDAARSRDDNEEISIENEVNDYDVAMVFGAGIDFSFGEWIGIADFRYDLGLVNAVEDPADGFEVSNRVAAIHVGIAF